MSENLDLVFVLGSQIMRRARGKIVLAHHTELKSLAAVLYYRQHADTCRFVVMGGYNFGVRYNDTTILKEPDFSFGALSRARVSPSEAETIRYFMARNRVPPEAIVLEELSATTEEQVKIAGILLKRTTFEGVKRVGILSVGPHLHKTYPIFKKELASFNVVPVYAEDVMRDADRTIHVRIYYGSLLKRNPAAVNFSAEQAAETLYKGRSIADLLHDWEEKEEWYDEPQGKLPIHNCYRRFRICRVCGEEEFISGQISVPGGVCYDMNEDGTSGMQIDY